MFDWRVGPELRYARSRSSHPVCYGTLISKSKDLRDILTVYQLWAHGMFPKGDFEGTIKRVETICRTRRMEVSSSHRLVPFPCSLPKVRCDLSVTRVIHLARQQERERGWIKLMVDCYERIPGCLIPAACFALPSPIAHWVKR